jgi:diguanylate cyclase (GGDEF)-like protein
MIDKTRTFSLPKWRLTRWLADPIQEVPYEIRLALISSLYGTLPIFIGGVVNTVLVSAVITIRQPQAAFLAWFAFEAILCVARTYLILRIYRAADRHRDTPTDLYILLALLWALGVGAGSFMSLLIGDWVSATLACLSSAAMMGGICFRNFAAPRLATAMIVLSFGPTCLGAIASGEPIMLLTALQIPFYLYAMGKAVYRLSAMLISTMRAERDNDHRARHDVLTGLPNRRFLMETSETLGSHPMVFAIVDIDHFKIVNDTNGHRIGDVVLQTVGALMATHLAAYGMVGRLGGEEFALIAPTASVDQIVTGLGELLRTVETTPIIMSGVTIHVTLSAGVAVRKVSEPFDKAYAEADAALYRAKRAGRNRIELARSTQVDHGSVTEMCQSN